MKLGLNLSFAIKRWIEPDRLAGLIRDELGMNNVQFTWDLVDPWWPEQQRDRIARAYAAAFSAAGLTVESSFGGLASYTYNHFLAPSDDLRALGKEHFKRAIDMTGEMRVPVAGMPFGSYSADDALDPTRRGEIYKLALEAIVDLSRHAKTRGLSSLMIEPVPLATEFPSTASDALMLMTDLKDATDVPVRLCVDWGHAMFTPLFKNDATMDHWMAICGNYIAAYHIQQTDGLLDRHWNFSRDGLVTPAVLAEFWNRHNLTDQTYLMEIIYAFEQTDEFVLQDMKTSIALLKQAA